MRVKANNVSGDIRKPVLTASAIAIILIHFVVLPLFHIVRKAVPIIDLFAGPGGLGEGFTSLVDKTNQRYFKIALSIEKDDFAHQTLTLRSFLRQFEHKKFPKEYYKFLRKEITLEKLYQKYPQQSNAAKNEAWKITLGKVDHSVVDDRIREALKGEKEFIVIGGPPCQAYSLVGRARRQEGLGLNKEDERVFLYREYYRILAVHNPPVFVMENVKGLLSSKIDNEHIFKQLINDLQNPVESYKKLEGGDELPYECPGYKIYSLVKKPHRYELDDTPSFKPTDFIIHAEKYGIPQTRHRVILLGIRNDFNLEPGLLKALDEHIPIERVLNGLPVLRSGLSKVPDGKDEWVAAIQQILYTGLNKEIDKEVWSKMADIATNISVSQRNRGNDYIEYMAASDYNPGWYLDKKLNAVLNHESRSHIKEDLYRYLFVSCFAQVKGRSPKLSDFPEKLLPKHGNVQSGIAESKFADRFRVQLATEPAKTITSHISKDGHYYIHPDSSQCRSLTVREAARIQTFPDNYFFCGPRTSQYHQVGNAVPPFLAHQIAEVVGRLMNSLDASANA